MAEERKDATLLPPRHFPADSRYSAIQIAKKGTLGSKDVCEQLRVPEGASEEEWLAVHTLDFFNELNLLVGGFADFCTEESCPEMSAGEFSYAWADGKDYPTPTKLSAPRYCEQLLIWVDSQLADENIMPTKPGVPFPPSYRKVLRVIYKRLFRIYAHTYHAHYQEIMEAECDAHLNHSFKVFVFFVKEFSLIDDDELEPMKDLIAQYMQQRQRDLAEATRAPGDGDGAPVSAESRAADAPWARPRLPSEAPPDGGTGGAAGAA